MSRDPDDGESSGDSSQSEMKKKERSIEIKRVHDTKDNKIRLTKPLVVSTKLWPNLMQSPQLVRDNLTYHNQAHTRRSSKWLSTLWQRLRDPNQSRLISLS